MSFRRFLYLVSKDSAAADRGYSLRRIDTSRFFFSPRTPPTPEGTPPTTPLDSTGATDPSTVDDGGRFPDPVINLCPLHKGHMAGQIVLVLFDNDKVLAIDDAGRNLLWDPTIVAPAVHYLPSLSSPKFFPFSLTAGDGGRILYVMDTFPMPPSGSNKRRSFEVLSNDDGNCKGWQWRPLDPPPHVHDRRRQYHPYLHIDSYAVVGGGSGTSIVVSNNAGGGRTFRFDTASEAWSKAGDWAMPFTRRAEHVPEHGDLWFGISNAEHGHRFCAADLLVAAALPESGEMRRPVARGFWKEYGEPPPEWSLGKSYAVYLGDSRFCIVRFFVVYGSTVHVCPVSYSTFRVEEGLQAVITGVEVEGGGGGEEEEEIRVVKHKSERYKLGLDTDCWVL
ncbi:unnamed protein product [Urochloa decumbens]|uniref:Uncharacterized protein n=1 Tax=Urochloa decumbens TaxID=240449 RepID=A0ABC9BAC6_9POAL